MTHRIEILTKVNDTRSKVITDELIKAGFDLSEVTMTEVFTINKHFNETEIHKIASMLANPVSQSYLIDSIADIDFDIALEIGYLPGVTDNIATTAKETIEDLLKTKFQEQESVHSSKLYFIKGNITKKDAEEIANKLSNGLIQRHHIKSKTEYEQSGGMDKIVPQVNLSTPQKPDQVDLNTSEEELIKLGKQGIKNPDGSRRGPLALDLDYLTAIKEYFAKEGRAPNDIELESIAQTWSEHCKHTIFASEIDEVKDGLYKGYIKKATQEIRRKKGDKDFCVSVFSDNAGGIEFDENWVVTDKAETHNTPSALDPFGGAITGIVGVNRDCIGFGKGAKPIINKYGFCTGNPDDQKTIYRDPEQKISALSPKRILKGVVEGVNEGGNCSGIPTPQGFVYFHDSYKGKPLIFVGTIGLIPKEINGEKSWEKSAQPGDKIIMVGGRVGQDGIHGATFSSEELSPGSPATAVQIGDPITQKKMSDAIIKELRNKNIYNSITDNGAGGISCSVAEMAKECGGCEVHLDKVPLKYPNLEPWKIWISESQERMTLAIPPEKTQDFIDFMQKRGVEATVIGEFTNSGRCKVISGNETIMDIDLDFLHNGLPEKTLKTENYKITHPEPEFTEPKDLTDTLKEMLTRPNIASYEFVSNQYDHNVQGHTVIGPVQGKGRVNGPASVTKPLFDSEKAVICSQGLNPTYSEIDSYDMAACAIDTAIRHVIAAGGTLDKIALMDNFCWCSSDDPKRLAQLKESAKACYDYAVKFETPYISGKDSMFNDFKGYDENGKPIKISALPTLLISSLGIIDNVLNSISIDPKFPEDLIYIIGETANELGGSEYFQYLSPDFIGNKAPKVDIETAIETYKKFEKASSKNLIASALSPYFGGIGCALAKKAIAGDLGMEIHLSGLPVKGDLRNDQILFSESQSRFIVTVAPENKAEFEQIFTGTKIAKIGKITTDKSFKIYGFNENLIINTEIQTLTSSYKGTFKDY